MTQEEEYLQAKQKVLDYENKQKEKQNNIPNKTYKCYECMDSGWVEGSRIGYDSIMKRCSCR